MRRTRDDAGVMRERHVPGTSLSRRFRLVLLHLAEEARRDLDGLKTRPERSIHSVRTRMKNLRAILMLVKKRIPKVTRKAINSLAGALKDDFSKQRDAYVVMQLRAKLNGRPEVSAGSATAKAAPMNQTSKKEADRLIRVLGKLEMKGLSWGDVIERYAECYRDGRKALKQCLRKPSAESLHKWRRPVKDLFYQSQVLQPLAGMKTRRLRAERLGDRLGKLNDLHMLQAEAKKSRGGGLNKRIVRKQRAIKSEVFKVAQKLFNGRPRKVALELERSLKFHPALAAQAVRQT
jgi:CHAD domain-containing protein